LNTILSVSYPYLNITLAHNTMSSQLRSLLGTIRKKPTKASDGRSAEASSGVKSDKKTSIGHDLKNLGIKDARFAVEAITTLASGEPLDDKELLLENGVQMLQGLPTDSGLSAKVSDGYILHPPVLGQPHVIVDTMAEATIPTTQKWVRLVRHTPEMCHL
jgi:hypothetical protein